jgi:hypothetical protein
MPRTTDVQLKLRFMESLRRKLERAAARNHRSMNTEIVYRLERTFEEDAAAAAGARAGRAAGRADRAAARADEGLSDDEARQRLRERLLQMVDEFTGEQK